MIQLLNNILTNVLTALYQPFWFSVLLSVMVMYFYLYSKEKPAERTDSARRGEREERGCRQSLLDWLTGFKTSPAFRRTFFLTFYTTLVLFRTLLNRDLWLNPLSNVMGGWTLTDASGSLTTESIENVLLLLPFVVLLLWNVNSDEKLREKVLGRDFGVKAVLWQSVKVAFLFSLSIEFLQLFLRLGTWQVSDIFYNTLGGFLGGVLYWCGHRGFQRKKGRRGPGAGPAGEEDTLDE